MKQPHKAINNSEREVLIQVAKGQILCVEALRKVYFKVIEEDKNVTPRYVSTVQNVLHHMLEQMKNVDDCANSILNFYSE